ncbi:Uncharacterized protein At4g28440 [Durusdinium trenchii]|uniref:Uncharacterized protein At4g28440 n=1 Tax=Durusdinium trenchii TaxID=1381693 RepID=A0ABP0S1B1_9DINO
MATGQLLPWALAAALFGAGQWCLFIQTNFVTNRGMAMKTLKLRERASGCARAAGSSSLTPIVTHFGVNTLALEIAGQRLLMDPLLVGKLVFWGQSWAFRGSRRYEFLTPEDVRESFDAIVITQSLDDHCHRPTLERIDRRMPIITNPSAAKTVQRLGYQPSTLRPGESLMLGHLCISAIPGSVVGPPWQDPENGYVFTDTRRGGWSIGTEPHGNFFGPALGTSFKRLPSAPRQPLDALILPLRAQQISGYRLVNGVQEAADTLEALDPVPRFLLPLPNAEIDASGLLAEQLKEDGSVESFREQQRERPKLRQVWGESALDLPGYQQDQLGLWYLIGEDRNGIHRSMVEITPSLQGYFAAPRLKSGRRMGLVLVHDISGFAAPNWKYHVDYWAQRGFETLMPEFFSEVKPPAGAQQEGFEISIDLWEKIYSQAWILRERPARAVLESIAFLRKEGCIRFGLLGFGWGGLAAERSAQMGHFAAAVSVDGLGHSAVTYNLVKDTSPHTAMLYVLGDEGHSACLSTAAAENIVAAGGRVEILEGVAPGFLASDEMGDEAANKGLQLIEEVFSQACLQKPTFKKLGTLHPDARGDVLVKVLAEAEAVERDGTKFFEVLCGDETAQVILCLQESQLTDSVQPGKVLAARNSSIRMVEGFMRLTIDELGKLDVEVKSIEKIGKTNLSQIEYELVET